MSDLYESKVEKGILSLEKCVRVKKKEAAKKSGGLPQHILYP